MAIVGVAARSFLIDGGLIEDADAYVGPDWVDAVLMRPRGRCREKAYEKVVFTDREYRVLAWRGDPQMEPRWVEEWRACELATGRSAPLVRRTNEPAGDGAMSMVSIGRRGTWFGFEVRRSSRYDQSLEVGWVDLLTREYRADPSSA